MSFPFFFFWYILLSSCLFFGLLLFFLGLMSCLIKFLLRYKALISSVVGHSCIEGVHREAGLVYQWDGHERSKSWNCPEVHSWLDDDLLDVDMFEFANDVFAAGKFDLLVGLSDAVAEYVVADALTRLDDGAHDEVLVVLVGIFEFDDLWFIEIQMCAFFCIISDLSKRRFKLTNVHAC
jgi:hypothetical protein